MKKFYYFFLMVVCMICGTTQTMAQYEVADDPATVIETGKKYVLQSAKDLSKIDYFKYYASTGTYFSTKADDETIVEFVEAGDTEDGMSYYVKNVANEAYVEDPGYTFSSTYLAAWTTDQSRAARLIPVEQDLSDGTAGFKLKSAEMWSGYVVYFCPFAFLGPGYNLESSVEAMIPSQTWIVYEVSSMGGRSELENLIDTWFPGGVTADTWIVGTTPGCISQEMFDELKSVFDEVYAVSENKSATDAEIEEATEKLKAIYAKVMAAVIPLTDGYYFVHNPGFEAWAYAYKYSTEYGTFNSMRWTTLESIEKYVPELAKYIWKIEKDDEGYFTFYNMVSESYLPSSSSQGAAIVLNNTPGQFAVVFQPENVVYRGGVFNINNVRISGRPLELLDGNNVGYSEYSDPTDEYALWTFKPVPEEMIQAMEDEKQKAELVAELTDLVEKAENTYEKTKVYKSDVVLNGIIDTPGMVEYAVTNAQEETEGDVAFAIDGVVSTFFHSAWSTKENPPAENHYIEVSLTEPVKTFALKMVSRQGGNAINPTLIEVLASNDAEGTYASVGTYGVRFNKSLDLGDGTDPIENAASVTFIEMPESYSRIRVKVLETNKPASTLGGYPYFNLAEIGVFAAEYDAENSPYTQIDAQILKNFEDALETATNALRNDAVTRDVLNNLSDAYAALLTQFADPDVLREILAEARTFYDTAVEGDELGQYQAGSTDAYNEALNAIEAKITNMMTPAAMEELIDEINKAFDDFNANLNQPDPDKFYHILCASSDSYIYGHYLYVRNNDVSPASLSFSVDESSEMNEEVRLNYMWRFVPAEGGYYLQNAATGTYLGELDAEGADVKMTYTPTLVELRSARSAEDAYNFGIDGEYVGLKNYSTVKMENPKGSDNGAFMLMPADYQATYYVSGMTNTQIVTYPFAVRATNEAGLYKVLGVKDEKLQMKRYAKDEVIEAGVPFLFVDINESGEVYFDVNAENPADLTYAAAPQTANGMVGTYVTTAIDKPMCVIRNNKIDFALEGQRVQANSGYFDLSNVTAATEDGDFAIELSAEVVAGIEQVVIAEGVENAKTGTYSVTGQRLSNGVVLKNLPKGIYIVNGRKVVVK